MAVFVVERYLAGWSPDSIRRLVQRVEGADDLLASEGVRHVQSMVLPDDETCLCVFEAPDADAVRRANVLAELPHDRIVPGEVLER